MTALEQPELFGDDPLLVRVDREASTVQIRIMLTFNRAATDFLGDCERRGFAATTLRDYQRAYDQFAGFIPIDTDVAKITSDDVRRYLNTKANLARGTRHGYECALSSLFKWLLKGRKIARDPMVEVARTRQLPSDELDVTTVSTEEVKLMLAAASGWTERLCLGVLVYTGCRRRAASRLRLIDYDELHRRLRFREKGGKVIWKPVPDELDKLIRSAIAAGVYDEADYLIPNKSNGRLARDDRRDDRFIWRTVKDISERAGVKCHTHALRAAFAVYYLETHKRDTLALQSLLGHRSGNTTQVYLRKLDRQTEMERVRDLSWGVAVGGDTPPAETPEIAGKISCDEAGVGAGGFEPPEAVDPLPDRPHTQHLVDALQERLDQAVSEKAEEPV